METELLEKQQKQISCVADIEIGTIFCASWGYDQTNVDFYKVIRKTAAMVEVVEVGQKMLEATGFMAEYVNCDPYAELYERLWVISGDSYSEKQIASEKGWVLDPNAEQYQQKPSCWIDGVYVYQDQAVGYKKLKTSKHKVQFSGSQVYLKMSSYKYANLWDGKKKYQSHYA